MGKRILVADDSDSILTVLRLSLEFKGYTVIVAEDGQEAFEKFQSEGCDLLVTDLAMPRMTGLELIHKIRRELGNESLPIIVCTAEALGNEKKFLDQGANALLNKPISPADLLALVPKFLDES